MNSPAATRLIVEDLSYSIDGEQILSDINFTLNSGEVSCLIGPSGCGKTTLLRLIAGLLSPDQGHIHLDDSNITRVNGDLRLIKHPVMMVFQDLGLFPHMNVAQNVAYGLTLNSRARRKIVEQTLEQLDLGGFTSRYPHELSGGQQQRIALARALVLNPRVLLLDEPFANLDTALRQPLAEEVLTLLKQRGIITLLVTHDREDALSLGNFVGVMGEGKILQWDTPSQLLFNPLSSEVARFTGHNSVIKGVVDGAGIVGTVLGPVKPGKTRPSRIGHKSVNVLIRCSDLKVTQDTNNLNALVIYRSFEAEQLVYALRLENNEQVFALAGRLPDLKVGDRTNVEMVNSSTTVYC